MLCFFPLLPIIFGSILAGGAAGFATGLIIGFISELIDDDSIREEVRAHNEFKNAFKAFIKDKNVRKVKADIWDNNANNLGSIEIESSKGVSDSIYVGQTIYLQ